MIERYTLPEMAAIWSLQNKFQKWLDVEIAVCEVHAEDGVIPADALNEIKSKAMFSVERINEIEKTTDHDVIAFTTNLAENIGPASRFVHYGLTSSDVVDTANALLLKESCELLLSRIDPLLEVLKRRAYDVSTFPDREHDLSAPRSGQNPALEAERAQLREELVHEIGPNARPVPTRIHFTDDGKPGAAVGVGGALYPEWDVFNDRYKPDWCRVIDFPLTVAAEVTDAGVVHDDVLRRRLARVGLGPKVLRGRADGDDLDIEALIDLFVDLQSGFSPPEHVYLERRKLARNLGVLILIDASGSAVDADSDGLAVHDHQRRAAATLAVTLEDLGDRVAVYAFRSQGRHAVHLPAIKTFDQSFGAVGRARLNQLEPASYTRLGAGIRGAGEVLKTEAGTPNRLLLVLSDGFPYDDGYEGRYAESDASKALEELRADGVACLCLSIGASTGTDVLERVFGSASFASAPTLADLSPQMDELFMSALRELAAPTPSRG